MNNIEEINKRRIFGIISHPDAGKTTLTEKLLLHGGAIHQAGSVKSRKGRSTTSDWMEIEKQRGISVTSSVMQFDYKDKKITIMDTPGHNDFGEDTYRILTSVDNAVMVIDCAKGVEAQTEKLFKVCSMRQIPIFTFINKLDREAKAPLDLLEMLESALGLPSFAITWPIGSGSIFEGIYDRIKNEIHLFKTRETIKLSDKGVYDKSLDNILLEENLENLRTDIELLDGAGNEFDINLILKGKLSPVFFGTALTDFGIKEFLDHFLEISPPPSDRKTVDGTISPLDNFFSGFIFKIQANMNPAHRDRLAFLRICSGTFHRGMSVRLSRTGKQIKLNQSTKLMANERETVDIAQTGDIIGIYDSGTYQIGDTLTDNTKNIFFEPLPTFPPELFMKVRPINTMKAKHFQKGVAQLAQEGAIQIYKNDFNEVILGAVGQLQFEVFEHRMKNEYNSDIRMESMHFTVARWIKTDDIDSLRDLQNSRCTLVFDHFKRPVLLFANQYTLDAFSERNESINLVDALNIQSVLSD